MPKGSSVPLKPSELAKYGDLFERLLDCVFLLDPINYVVLEANPACERTLGVTEDKIIGRPLSQWIDGGMQDDLLKAFRVAMRRYYPRQFDVQFKTPDGRMLTMEVLACPLKLSKHTEILQVIARDVTFRREAEMKLQLLLQDLQTANEKLVYLTTVDEMTGLYNFRHFRTQLHAEHARAIRDGKPYSILFCDIDHFKNYNDENGHPAGDRLLQMFSRILKKSCRASDIVSRYGGEEFAVICPGAHVEGALVIGERIRKSVEEANFTHGESQPGGKVTISVGAASYPMDGTDPESIVRAADEAVYLSKEEGRNRVTSATALRKEKKTA